jgi:hypothetical protein
VACGNDTTGHFYYYIPILQCVGTYIECVISVSFLFTTKKNFWVLDSFGGTLGIYKVSLFQCFNNDVAVSHEFKGRHGSEHSVTRQEVVGRSSLRHLFYTLSRLFRDFFRHF